MIRLRPYMWKLFHLSLFYIKLISSVVTNKLKRDPGLFKFRTDVGNKKNKIKREIISRHASMNLVNHVNMVILSRMKGGKKCQ